MSLRARLTLWNVAILALALLLLGGTLRARVQYHLLASIDHELTNRADRRSGPRGGPRRGGRERFQSDSDRARHEREEKDRPRPTGEPPPIYDLTGKNVFNQQPALDIRAIHRVLETRTALHTTNNNRRLYTKVLVSQETNKPEAIVQISEPLEPVQREVAQVTGELVALIPIALLIAGTGGLFLTSRALRPIRQVTDAAAALEATDLSQRLTVQGSDELARLASTFNAMLGRLEAAFDRQRRFTADASHELKSPLTTIKLTAGFGLTDPSTSETSKALFSKIDRAADRTTRLVQNLLTLARSDASALVLERSEIKTDEFVTELLAELALRYPSGATLHTELATETLCGDPQLVHQLLLNILDNALRHTPSTGSVTLRIEQTESATRLTVADTGIGIAAEHLPHLRERFYRVDTARARKDGGSGLGLAICQGIVDAHAGTLEIESTLGVGTTIEITLPKI